MRRRLLFAAITILGSGLLALGWFMTSRQDVEACGPFFSIPLFVSQYSPDPPIAEFAAGRVGHVRPTWARRYLTVAYRYLSGNPLTQTEQQGVMKAPGDDDYRERDRAKKEWLAAREAYGLPAPQISSERPVGPNALWTFVNCPTDAFATARATLAARAATPGLTRAALVEWVRAQDQVFGNCAGGHDIPAPLPASAPLLARQDRAYQIAAAAFYATDYDEAERAFRGIADDRTSPWRRLAPYLAARCLVRKGTVKAGEDQFDRALLEQAARELQAFEKTADAHDRGMAGALLGFVLIRTAPIERTREIASHISKGDLGAGLKQALTDYTWLLDRAYGEDRYWDPTKSTELVGKAFDRLAEWRAMSDLTDWIITFQSEEAAAAAHALSRWRESHSPAWLVAALDKARPDSANLAALLQAAGDVKPDSPAYASVLYHTWRLRLARGDEGVAREARQALDQLFTSPPAWPQSTLNELRAMRMSLASSFDDWVRYAPRVPAAATTDADTPVSDVEVLSPRWKTAFDTDAARAFNVRMPVSVLARVASSTLLSDSLRGEVGLAAWTRAVLLDNDHEAQALFPFIERAVPAMKAELAEYRSGPDATARQRAALFLLLKLPGLRPDVATGLGRDPDRWRGNGSADSQPLATIDSLRDNWWCEGGSFSGMSSYTGTPWMLRSAKDQTTGPEWPSFEGETDRAAARRELVVLQKLPTAAIYLCDRTVAWAKATPNDPRIPEALYLAIRSSRYGCQGTLVSVSKTGQEVRTVTTAASSGAAFRLLKSRYANTEWAKKTKYYY